ncbi:MAG: VIT1/CCC1 transporter family protein [Pirellulales bacterium]
MDQHLTSKNLPAAHTPKAIAARLSGATSHNYLGDFVLGAIDGTVTTFAVVSGVAGANLAGGVALVLGVANLLADGLSMAAGNYLSTKSERQVIERVRRVEQHHIEHIPEGEREEVRQIFSSKGFEGDVLESVVDVITEDRNRWIDTMVTEEFGLPLETPSPMRAGLSTFIAFVIAGFVPLAPYCFATLVDTTSFTISCAATGATFFLIGLAKGHVVGHSKFISGLEVLTIGSAAAIVAFFAGSWLESIIGL